jgi:hypothetical protein
LLELGLVRFVVEAKSGAAAGNEGAKVTTCPPQGTGAAGASATSFDLRDLAEGTEGSSRFGMPDTAFAGLPMGGAQPRSTADALSALLGETRRAEASSEPSARIQASGSVTPGARASPFEELHREFVRVVRDPDQLAGLVAWEESLVVGGEQAPTLNQLRKQAEHYPLLRDILLPPDGIDLVIEGFEPLSPSRLLDPKQPDDVLGLFAPELARGAGAPLPSLTRREHHALSPDSHVRIGTPHVRPGEDAAPNADDGATRGV